MAKAPAPDKRAQILEVAGKLFLKHGFAGTSMGDIARAGAGSKGTLYTYFASKEEMFEAFMAGEIAERANLTFELPPQAENPRATLKVLGVRYLKLITDPIPSQLMRVVVAEALNFPHIGKLFYEVGPQAAHARLASFLRTCTKSGSLAVPDPDLAAEQFLRLCQSGPWQEFLFGVRKAPTEAEISKTIDGAVKTFMAAFAPARK